MGRTSNSLSLLFSGVAFLSVESNSIAPFRSVSSFRKVTHLLSDLEIIFHRFCNQRLSLSGCTASHSAAAANSANTRTSIRGELKNSAYIRAIPDARGSVARKADLMRISFGLNALRRPANSATSPDERQIPSRWVRSQKRLNPVSKLDSLIPMNSTIRVASLSPESP